MAAESEIASKNRFLPNSNSVASCVFWERGFETRMGQVTERSFLPIILRLPPPLASHILPEVSSALIRCTVSNIPKCVSSGAPN